MLWQVTVLSASSTTLIVSKQVSFSQYVITYCEKLEAIYLVICHLLFCLLRLNIDLPLVSTVSAFHPSGVNKWVAGLFNRMCPQVAPSACEIKPHLIGCWQNLGAVCFWQPMPIGLNLIVAAVLSESLNVSLLPCVADCCMLYTV